MLGVMEYVLSFICMFLNINKLRTFVLVVTVKLGYNNLNIIDTKTMRTECGSPY